ncbi:hypothetical protein DY000_02048625 [Brassica cretica]|uniref:Uncharacterized protein n=1 Tax=Brassica cretica TaxID=69181 RepID=A0ABQ7F003_BRACR|nr:hypothetical protein DY000_02048625 [Brassica cretica]
MERASRDEPSYICLLEHASSFTQTKLVPEFYTKDEINEMFYGVCGEQEKNKEVFQMKLDGVNYPLNDRISWLTTCMKEMKQDIAKIQHATDVARSSSIDRYQQTSIDVHQRTSIDNQMPTSVDDNPPRPHTMKSQQNFHTREEIDQLVEGIYRALENTEERLDGRCDDIYFPMDLNISALTSKIEAIQGELVEIQSYIAHRPEASSSIDRRNNKSTDIHHRSSVDDATNRGRLIPKMTSNMSDTHYHEEEISADTYATLTRHQFNLESLEDRLQRIENTTATMKEKWRRGDEAMRDFTAPIDRRAPITYQVQMPMIDVARLNAVRPKPKPSENPPETVRAFLSTVGAVCNLKTIQMCLTLIDPNAHYDPIPVKKPHMSSRRINDPGIIAACHCGVEYDIEYSASIETHTTTSIDSANQKSTDNPHDESEDKLLHHSSWKRNAPSIDIPGSPSIDTQPHQRNRKRASTNITNYSSIDAEVNRVREGDYSIGIWADDHHHESYVVETTIYEPGADELHEGFTYEELLNMQRRDETAQHQSETVWGRIRYMHPIDRARRPSIDITPSTSIDLAHTTSIFIRSKPKTTVSEKDKFNNEYLTPDKFGIFRDPDGHARSIDGCILNVSRKDIADILQTANGAENLFAHNRNIPEYQQKDKKEFYDAAGGIDKSFKLRRAFDFLGTRRFYWEEKDQYGVYRDDQGCARDMDGHIINVSKEEIRKLMERASRDEPSYICLPEHASSFTQTKLVPEIYTKDEINEMFYGVVGEQEKNKEVLQMKLDGVYYPLNDSTSWLTTCMEEMKQDIARIQHATDVARSSSIDGYQQTSIDVRQRTSIDNQMQTSVDDNLPRPHTMKSQHNFHTREEIDQLVEGIYRALENIEDRLDGRCDDIYFPMDLNISALTSKIEAIQRELVEIHSYIARRPEASSSIDRRNNKSTDIHHRSSVDDATNRGRLVPKMTSDMSDTH